MPSGLKRSLPELADLGLVTRGRDSVVGLSTDIKKLNGQVYTPLPLAEHMLRLVAWPSDGQLLDPACGDGIFLEAAVRKVLQIDISEAAKREIIRTRLIGWDLDPEAIEASKRRLSELLKTHLRGRCVLPTLRVRNALVPNPSDSFACVVGNPPYLEAKRMPDSLKQLIRHSCPLASRGAFDLYTAFIERAYQLVSAVRGELCFLIPNRFLVVSYAESLRREVLLNLDVRVIDLSRDNVFDGAAVYPIVVHASPPGDAPTYRVLSREEAGPGVSVPARILLERLSGTMPLAPKHPGGQRLLSRILQDVRFQPMGRLAEVRWTVSFHKAGLRDQYVFNTRPSRSARFRPFLGGGRFAGNREVQRCQINWAGSWIDYDEPRAREDSNPLPPESIFSRPKVVVCQNARRARAAVDHEGYILKDTFLAVIPDNRQAGLLEWLCLVINSDLMHYIYEHLYAGTRKGGGYLHFLPRYLSPLPIAPVPDPEWARNAYAALACGESRWSEVEDVVRFAYRVSRSESKALAAYDFPRH